MHRKSIHLNAINGTAHGPSPTAITFKINSNAKHCITYY